MKTLKPISVGEYVFGVFVEHVGDSILKVTVMLDDEKLIGNLNHQGPHDHQEEQFNNDVHDFAVRLAGELAGKLRSKELCKKFTAT